MDLSEIFLHILETHHLTQRKASSILQYSSPNQLQRITKKEVSDKLMMDFGERLLIHREELDLTPDEIVSIRQCLFFPSMKSLITTMPRVCSPRFVLPFRFRRQRNCMSSPSPALRFTISISICPMPAAFISKSLDAICCLCGIRLKCLPINAT